MSLRNEANEAVDPGAFVGKSSESVQLAMLKACDACDDAQTWASDSALY